MVSARRLPTFLAQRLVEMYDGTLSKFPWRHYQPLPQNNSSVMDVNGRHKPGLGRPRLRKSLGYAVVFLCLIAALAVFSHGGSLASSSSDVVGPSRATISKNQYVAAVLREPVEGLLDTSPIRQKCDQIKFQEGLVWHCAVVVGGIGNVANEFLNCVRYAMEAGATTLVLPRLGHRADNLVSLGTEADSVDPSELLDIKYFLDSWKVACPQIRAVLSDSEVPHLDLSSSASSPHLSPSSVKSFPMRKYLIVDPTGWREAFDDWLAKNADGFKTMSAQRPVSVWQNLALAQWNRETHTPEFAKSFPRLFRYPAQTRRLAASALWSLEQKLGRPVVADNVLLSSTPTNSSRCTSLGPHRLLGVPDGFMGAHLRVAADAAAAGWPGYEAQAPSLLNEAKRLNLTTIYLATGSVEHRERFRADAEREGLSVVVKEDLLDENELARLQSLSWDQQALVDFDVLMHSTFFYGMVRSSFAWSLALRRGILPEAGTGTATPMPKESKDEYRDGLSALVQRYDSINPEGLWP